MNAHINHYDDDEYTSSEEYGGDDSNESNNEDDNDDDDDDGNNGDEYGMDAEEPGKIVDRELEWDDTSLEIKIRNKQLQKEKLDQLTKNLSNKKAASNKI